MTLNSHGEMLTGKINTIASPQAEYSTRSVIVDWEQWNLEYQRLIRDEVARMTGIDDSDLWPLIRVTVDRSGRVYNYRVLQPGRDQRLMVSIFQAFHRVIPPPFPQNTRYTKMNFTMGNTLQMERNWAPYEKY